MTNKELLEWLNRFYVSALAYWRIDSKADIPEDRLLEIEQVYEALKSLLSEPTDEERINKYAEEVTKMKEAPFGRVRIPTDDIFSPSHYTYGGLEVIEILKKKMTPEMYEGYLMGNLLAYIFRYRLKGNKLKDLQKAEVYLRWLIEIVGGK